MTPMQTLIGSTLTLLAVTMVLGAPRAVQAQDSPSLAAVTTVSVPVGPRPVRAGISLPASALAAPMPPMPAASQRDAAWMIIGGATLVVGSVVGGESGQILMIGGAVIGLVGLWRYLQ